VLHITAEENRKVTEKSGLGNRRINDLSMALPEKLGLNAKEVRIFLPIRHERLDFLDRPLLPFNAALSGSSRDNWETK